MPRYSIDSPSSPGSLAAWFHTLADKRPYFRSSFYLKAKLSNTNPQALPIQATVDITHQCSLGCPFCFASEVACRGDHFPVEPLCSLLHTLHGLPSLVLIGGEPFEHPEIQRILPIALQNFGEVEVYTSGAFFTDLERLRQRLTGIPKNLRQRLRLVLSVDAVHKQVLASQAENILQTVLEAEEQGMCRVRFNVTDATFSTHRYLGVPEVSECLETLSPALNQRFQNALSLDRVDEWFQFNPVIVQGKQEADGRAELLRLSDLLFHPEPVFRWQNGHIDLLRNLNAAWMPSPPPGLLVGPVEPDNLAETFRHHFLAAEEMGEDGSPLSEGDLILTRLRRYLETPEGYQDALAQRALSVLPTQGLAVELSSFWRVDRLGPGVYRRLLSQYLDTETKRQTLIQTIAHELISIVKQGSPGVKERDDYGHELGLCPFAEVGFQQAQALHALNHSTEVHPRLWLDDQGQPHLEIPGLVALPSSPQADENWQALFDLLAQWLDDNLLQNLAQALEPVPIVRNRLLAVFSQKTTAKASDDATALFNHLAFDANRNGIPWQAEELTEQTIGAMMNQASLPCQDVDTLLDELRYWRQRPKDTQPR